MRGFAAFLVLLGLGAILLPILGLHFRIVTGLAELLHVSEAILGAILIAVGLFIGVFPLGALLLPLGAVGRSRHALDGTAISLDEILANRGDALSEEAVRKIHPFYWEIILRLRRERYDALAAAIAPRAGVTVDDVILFNLAATKAIMARHRAKDSPE